MAGKSVKVVVSKGGRIEVEAMTGTNRANASAAKAPSNTIMPSIQSQSMQNSQSSNVQEEGAEEFKKKEERKAK